MSLTKLPPTSGFVVTRDGVASRVEPPPPEKVRAERQGRLLQMLGKVSLGTAFVLFAYILWMLIGTNFYTARAQNQLREEIDVQDRPGLIGASDPEMDLGNAYAILEIPRMDLEEVVVEGVEVEDLKKGPGHYERTGDPWDRGGRVGIAGHRTTYGAPFWDLDKLRPGDTIRLLTEQGTYRYEVTELREVLPSDDEVLKAPKHIGASLVLTTCTPRFSASRRLIAFADRIDPYEQF
ncbi:MAG TPA: sortase [Actinomycetota bacterium]|nr:sortase [Actinomycetota bacterium]